MLPAPPRSSRPARAPCESPLLPRSACAPCAAQCGVRVAPSPLLRPCPLRVSPPLLHVSPPPLLPARPPPLRPARRRQSAAPAPCALVRRPDTVRVSPPAQHRAPHSAGPAWQHPGPVRQYAAPASCASDGQSRAAAPALRQSAAPAPCASSRRPGTLCVSPPGRRPGQYGAPPQYSARQFTASASCASVRCPGTLCVSPPGRRPGQPGSTVRRPSTVRRAVRFCWLFVGFLLAFCWLFFHSRSTAEVADFRQESNFDLRWQLTNVLLWSVYVRWSISRSCTNFLYVKYIHKILINSKHYSKTLKIDEYVSECFRKVSDNLYKTDFSLWL